ncbi:MAG: 50S ribosomal protein L3 [Puniceicoccales bacterium]|jgi:large subunit ribosomal protein L3|nr:50S ribosomal protein L3 [Puniceicoccales bacterium]
MEEKRNILMVGKKVGMTQLYDANGVLVPVTIVEMCRTSIAGMKTADSDGYFSILFGFFNEKRKKIGDGRKPADFDILKELRVANVEAYEIGTSICVGEFAKDDPVDVVGTTKGKGFQGVMKRHGFAGGPASHGSMFHRRGGSYGNRQWPGHVFKGRKMPGHDGCDRRTVQNLKIFNANPEKHLLVISGSFPGANGSYVVVRRAKKSLQIRK